MNSKKVYLRPRPRFHAGALEDYECGCTHAPISTLVSTLKFKTTATSYEAKKRPVLMSLKSIRTYDNKPQGGDKTFARSVTLSNKGKISPVEPTEAVEEEKEKKYTIKNRPRCHAGDLEDDTKCGCIHSNYDSIMTDLRTRFQEEFETDKDAYTKRKRIKSQATLKDFGDVSMSTSTNNLSARKKKAKSGVIKDDDIYDDDESVADKSINKKKKRKSSKKKGDKLATEETSENNTDMSGISSDGTIKSKPIRKRRGKKRAGNKDSEDMSNAESINTIMDTHPDEAPRKTKKKAGMMIETENVPRMGKDKAYTPQVRTSSILDDFNKMADEDAGFVSVRNNKSKAKFIPSMSGKSEFDDDGLSARLETEGQVSLEDLDKSTLSKKKAQVGSLADLGKDKRELPKSKFGNRLTSAKSEKNIDMLSQLMDKYSSKPSVKPPKDYNQLNWDVELAGDGTYSKTYAELIEGEPSEREKELEQENRLIREHLEILRRRLNIQEQYNDKTSNLDDKTGPELREIMTKEVDNSTKEAKASKAEYDRAEARCKWVRDPLRVNKIQFEIKETQTRTEETGREIKRLEAENSKLGKELANNEGKKPEGGERDLGKEELTKKVAALKEKNANIEIEKNQRAEKERNLNEEVENLERTYRREFMSIAELNDYVKYVEDELGHFQETMGNKKNRAQREYNAQKTEYKKTAKEMQTTDSTLQSQAKELQRIVDTESAKASDPMIKQVLAEMKGTIEDDIDNRWISVNNLDEPFSPIKAVKPTFSRTKSMGLALKKIGSVSNLDQLDKSISGKTQPMTARNRVVQKELLKQTSKEAPELMRSGTNKDLLPALAKPAPSEKNQQKSKPKLLLRSVTLGADKLENGPKSARLPSIRKNKEDASEELLPFEGEKQFKIRNLPSARVRPESGKSAKGAGNIQQPNQGSLSRTPSGKKKQVVIHQKSNSGAINKDKVAESAGAQDFEFDN